MMDYNNYYPVQTGPPPLPPPSMMNNQPDCSLMSGSMTPNSLMHSSPAPSTPQSMRHTPGPPPMQQHHPMGHHPQQQSPHPNYHQLPSHPPISHSASPHPASTPQSQGQPPPRPATGPSPLHHHMPPHMNGQSPKLAPPGPMPPVGPMHPSVMSGNNHHQNHHHHQPGPPPPPPHGHAYPNNPMPPHYGQPPPMNHVPQPIPNGHMMAGPPPPHPSSYMPPHPGNQERGSPFFQHMPQTEFRLMELNKRLQSRPPMCRPSNPLPHSASYEQSIWWERFACDFFDNEATLTISTPSGIKPTEYTIGRALIPRFFTSYFEGNVTDLSFKLRNARETQHHPNLTTMDCDQADIITKNIFKHPSGIIMCVVVHTEGHLSLEFVNNSFDTLVIKSWRFYVSQCHEYVDRSMANTAIPYLTEPITRFGLPKSTCAYLKMCLVMEPMQDMMSIYKQSNIAPSACLKKLLHERGYMVKSEDKTTTQTKKQRKRKQPEGDGAKTKRSRAGANMSNNIGMMTEAQIPNLPLASQDVLIVGEPSMLGADFGDENERRITRLENNQYDSSIDQGSQQSGILNDSNQMNQICTPNTNMSQEQQSDISSHLAHGNEYESGSMLGVPPPNSDHNEDSINSQGSMSKHELSEPNNAISMNNNNGNCLQGDNDLASADDTRNHMNPYYLNGETNHIKSEMDLPIKQSMQANPITESELNVRGQ